jgi:diphthamide biosynthesis protein 7
VHVKTWKVFDDSVLITYFAWCPLAQEEGTKSLVLAASTGVIQLITVTEDLKYDVSSNDLSLRREDPALSLHSLKVPYVGEEPQYAYCCVWASAPGGLSNDFSGVFSGGDDSKLRTSILGTSREANDNFNYKLPITLSGHDAAVISILPLPCADKKWILLTGSYDNKVRILTMDWDSQTKQKSIDVSAILDVGGGAYRLEFIHDCASQPAQNINPRFQVLATCMEAGVKILDIQRKEDVWSMNVIAHADIEAPKSSTPSNTAQLCYASAVQQNVGNKDVIFVSSCFTKRQIGVYRFTTS